jgi:hypothetical protein
MVDDRARRAKLLFVLSNDYGELSNAMYLLTGCEFRPLLLMPDRLFAVNQDTLPVPASRYGTLQDALAAVERERPDIVFLFSGYLYAINDIFDLETVETLVRELRNRRQRIVTSDPFLGVMAEVAASTFSDRHPRKQWLTDHFARLFQIFREVPHLYLFDATAFPRTRSLSFYNPHILLRPDALAESERAVAGRVGVDPAKKRWVFVMSLEDYGGQAARHGRARFDEMLIATLQQTAREGRQPVLVGPDAALAAIRSKGPAIDGLVLLAFCSHEVFKALLLGAEYAFYWNIFSNSIPARIANHLPVFFFDPGHMVHAIPPLFELGMKHYYSGAALTYLDQRQALTAAGLAVPAAEQEHVFRKARERFPRSPTPDAMVEQILRG